MTCRSVHIGAGHPEPSVAIDKSMPEQVHILKHLWPSLFLGYSRYTSEVMQLRDESTLEEVHLGASVAVQEVMLEHLKACTQG